MIPDLPNLTADALRLPKIDGHPRSLPTVPGAHCGKDASDSDQGHHRFILYARAFSANSVFAFFSTLVSKQVAPIIP
ncbi:hypothetical protein [Paracoccus sp. (in: a-proteobacteria)]|uniref:hypothetical protein n=1 Tax=Paracoccus sp. TaxID=267 RepID=UPI002AFE83C6|nr:hypothetical protein [Paracoccus sp. (in: a-proteobacteria)]